MKTYRFTYYLFWIAVIFFTDPGGFFIYYLGTKIFGIIPRELFYTVIAYGCFIIDYSKNSKLFNNKHIIKYIKYAGIWLLYYLIVFIWLNNDTPEAGLRIATRITIMITPMLMVIPIVYYSIKSIDLFLFLLIRITIIILLLFFTSVITGLELMPTRSLDRGYIDISRVYMWGIGIIFLLVPLTIGNLLSPFKKIRYILFAGLLTIITVILTITRRHIIGILESYIIIVFILNYVKGKHLLSTIKQILNTRIIIYLFILITVVYLVFPSYIRTTILTIDNVITQFNEDVEVDERLSFSKQETIVRLIKDNPIIGTGYNYLWYTQEGDDIGMEGADYMLLGSVAMYGILGLLTFIPIYYLVIRIMIRFYKLIKLNRKIIFSSNKEYIVPFIIFLGASTEFIKNIIEYPNWFAPLWDSYFFILIGLLIGNIILIENNIKVKKIHVYED